MTHVFLILGIIFCVVFLTKRTAKVTLNVAFLKAITSMCFILTGLFAFVANDNCPKIVGALVAAAGVWGLLGDIALDLKYVFKKYEGSYLTAGFSSFLVGHIFYSFAMVFAFGFEILPLIIGVVVGVLVFVFSLISEPILKCNYGNYKMIAAVYMAVLSFTVGFSVGYAIVTSFATAAVIFAVGLVLFILSDLVLAGIYFSIDEKKRVSRPSIILNHIFYYAAQFTIAISIYFIEGIK